MKKLISWIFGSWNIQTIFVIYYGNGKVIETYWESLDIEKAMLISRDIINPKLAELHSKESKIFTIYKPK